MGPVVRAARYWTIAIILNNLLNGSPELSYYAPQTLRRWFVPAWGAVALAGLCVPAILPAHGGRAVGTSIAVTWGLFGLPALLFVGLLAKLWREGADSRLLLAPRVAALLHEAIVARGDGRRALAEQALALDPGNVSCLCFLAWLDEAEPGRHEEAVRSYRAAIAALQHAIETKKRLGGAMFTRERGLEAHFQARLDAIEPDPYRAVRPRTD